MDDQAGHDVDALTAEPDQLDGHTIDELADYLDNDRTPVDPSIEHSPACQHALAALQRLRAIAPNLLVDDRYDHDEGDGWLEAILGRISADAHAGADFLISVADDGDETVMTEGTLRAIIRAAGDDRPGFLVGRIRFTGDLDGGDEPVTIAVDVLVAHGIPIPAGVIGLRQAILTQILQHTRLADPRIDITVRDLLDDPA